jgi:putative intracellular protease/amidase
MGGLVSALARWCYRHRFDQEVVIDRQFTTSRSPADLPAFCPAVVDQFSIVPAAPAT